MGARAGRAASSAVAVILLAGCSGPSEPAAPPPPFATHQVTADTEIPAAEIAGRLTLVNGCLMVAPAAAAVVPVVLPDQAVWDPELESVSMGDHSFAVGDEVAWSGAYGFASEDIGVPSTCPDAPEVGIVYEMSTSR